MKVINPKILVRLYGSEILDISDARISVSINKNLEDKPNEATVTIFNLNETTRNQTINPELQDVPIEIYLNEFNSEDLVLAFKGEIDNIFNQNTRPGYITTLNCLSQKEHHTFKYIDKKTYAKGTPINQIVQDFIDVIELPYKTIDLPDTGIMLSASFSGPAFTALQGFIRDIGYFAYILDGVLYIASIYEPIETSSFEIPLNRLLAEPTRTTRTDAKDIEIRTIVESSGIDPFDKVKKRKKKTKPAKGIKSLKPFIDAERVKKIETQKQKKAQIDELNADDYTEYEVVDMTITGMDFELLMFPSLQPDMIINLEGQEKLYRIREVTLDCDNFTGDSSISLETDDFESDDQ